VPGWRIEANVKSPEQTGNTLGNPDAFTAYLDRGKTGQDIKVRSFRRGDRFQPLGLGQEKESSSIYAGCPHPQVVAPRHPVFYTPQQIVWIAATALTTGSK